MFLMVIGIYLIRPKKIYQTSDLCLGRTWTRTLGLRLHTHLLQASERILLSSMGASSITNAGVNLVASLCQGIHIALHCHGDVTVPLAVANRALIAASTCKPFSMYAYSLLASIFDIAGYSTSPVVLQRFPGLHAGIFALLDACTDPKVKKRLIA